MRLTNITVHGLKGISGRNELAGVDIFTGPNRSGKTTRLLAVQAGLAGGRFPFLPDGCASTVQIGLGFYDGTGPVSLQRTLAPKHAAAVMPGPTGIKPVDAWVSEHIGTPGIGVSDFLALSPGQREMRLLGLVRTLPDSVPNNPDAVEDALEAVASYIPRPDEYGVDAARSCAWLGKAIEALRSEKSRRERDNKAVERSLADLAKADDGVPPGSLPEAREKLAALRASHADAKGQLAALRKLGGSAKGASERATLYEAEAEGRKAELMGMESEANLADTLDAPIRALKATLPDIQALQRASNEASNVADKAARKLENAKRTLADAERTLANREAAARAYTDGKPCGCCGRPLDETCAGVDQAIALLETAKTEQRAFADALAVAVEAADTANQAATAAHDVLAAAATVAEPIKAKVAMLEAERDAQIAALRKRRTEVAQAMVAATAAAREARTSLASLPADVDPDLLMAQVEGIEAEIEAAVAVESTLSAVQSREEERQRWIRQQKEHLGVIEAVKAALEQLTTWRTCIVESSAIRLAAAANDVAGEVFPGFEFTTVATDKGTDIRLHSEGVDVPLEGWADSEILVFGVAATVALMAECPPPWRVLMVDEVQRLDPETLSAFVVSVAKLVHAGRLDNVILAGALSMDHISARPRVTDPTFLRVIRLHRLEMSR